MFEPISIDQMTSEMLKLTENSVLAEVSRKLLTLENQEEIYHCDYLADCVLKDDNNPGNSYMIDAAMCCVSSIMYCVNFIKDALFERLNFAQDIRSYYSRRRAELERLLDEFKEHVE